MCSGWGARGAAQDHRRSRLHIADAGRTIFIILLTLGILVRAHNPPSISLRNERVAERHLAAVVLSEFFRFVPARFKKIQDLVRD